MKQVLSAVKCCNEQELVLREVLGVGGYEATMTFLHFLRAIQTGLAECTEEFYGAVLMWQ